MHCPFCKKKVEIEDESIRGCKACIQQWLDTKEVDHPVD